MTPIRIDLPRGSYVPRIVPLANGVNQSRPTGAIAVLPFVHLGPEPDGEFLSDGLTEEIIGSLGTLPGFRVVARTSAFQFKNKGGNVQDIGRSLKADHLIEGSVRRSRNHLKVNARLIDASTGYQVWSHAVRREHRTTSSQFKPPLRMRSGAALGGQQRGSRQKGR